MSTFLNIGSLAIVCSLLFVSTHAIADPVTVILLPVDFEIREHTASGVAQTDVEGSESACENFEAATLTWISARSDFHVVPTPAVSPAQQDLVDDHIALFNLTFEAAQILKMLGGETWSRNRHSYTLGDGLSFLQDMSGAQKLFVMKGFQFKRTGGREATNFLKFMATAGMYNPELFDPMERGSINIGLVDLATGDIDWLGHANVEDDNMTSYDEVCDVIDNIMKDFPSGGLLESRS